MRVVNISKLMFIKCTEDCLAYDQSSINASALAFILGSKRCMLEQLLHAYYNT